AGRERRAVGGFPLATAPRAPAASAPPGARWPIGSRAPLGFAAWLFVEPIPRATTLRMNAMTSDAEPAACRDERRVRGRSRPIVQMDGQAGLGRQSRPECPVERDESAVLDFAPAGSPEHRDL